MSVNRKLLRTRIYDMDSDKIAHQKTNAESRINEKKITFVPTITDLYVAKTDLYTTAVGSYRAWSIDVNLGPPNLSTPIPPEDKHIVNYYDALQYSLYENNFPETIDRSESPRTHFKDNDVTIALLSSPVECLAIVLAGGKICPNDMLLVLSSSWVTKSKSDKNPELFSLFVHKGITFDSGGNSFLDTYNPPRRVTYLVNFFTRACTDGQRSDGETLETDLDCAMSSSLNLVKMVDDKLWTRILTSKVKGDYPETLAFTYKCHMTYDVTSCSDITVVKLNTKTGVKNLILEELQRFLKTENVMKRQRIVVKPSGAIWHGSLGVSYHSRSDVTGIQTAVVNLLADIEPENSILVETFFSPPLHQNGQISENLSFRLRSTVCRGFGNRPVTTSLICGVGERNSPINGDNTVPQTLDTTLCMCGISDAAERKHISKTISKVSEDMLVEIANFEKDMTAEERGGVGGRTDIIGLDFVLGEKEGVTTPIVIEVNSHDCTINCQLFESMNPDLAGKSVGPAVETMVERSQRHLMEGKRIIVIGAGGFSKRFIWKAAQNYGIKIVLVDDSRDSFASEHVDKFFFYDFSDHKEDALHARNIIQLLEGEIPTIDGCCTFWEDCGPLAATICDRLKYNGAGMKGACLAKKKSSTQQFLRTRDADIPHFPRTYLYTGRSAPITSSEDIGTAIDHVGFPAVLKLEYGSSAVGVKLVNNREECKFEYDKIRSSLKQESDHPGIGLGHGNSMMLMEYFDGTEHDIDVIIFQRRLIAAFISDNGPTRPGLFTETGASMPSCLRSDKANQLRVAAYQCCTELGLVSGVFNVEMKMTPTGPKLIEINARMGGFYLRDWIKTCYDVDLLLYTFMIAVGIKPSIPKNINPRCHIMGVMCVPSAHREVLCRTEVQNNILSLSESNEIRYNEIESEESLTVQESVDTEEPYCNIAVMADSLEMAKYKLIEVCDKIGIHNSWYNVPAYLEDFKSYD